MSINLSQRSRVLSEFGETITDWGTIQGPGKFESEPWWSVLAYDLSMNGDFGDTFGNLEFVVLGNDLRAEWELEPSVHAVCLEHADSGFVYTDTYTELEYNKEIEYQENKAWTGDDEDYNDCDCDDCNANPGTCQRCGQESETRVSGSTFDRNGNLANTYLICLDCNQLVEL